MTGHIRHLGKNEYDIRVESSAPSIFMAYTEKTAVARALEYMDEAGLEEVRLYHTYPSPGPVDRYVGVIKNGRLHRAV